MALAESRFDSPCGALTVVTHDGRLVGLGFADGDAEAHTDAVLGAMFGLDTHRLARDAARLVVTRGS